MTSSPSIFIGNASIIKKIRFPRNIIPLSIVLQDMIHFILSIPVIIIFLFIYRKTPSLTWLYGIPILLSLQLLLTYGTSLIIASTNLFFKDIEKLTIIFTTFIFYFTPIIYSETIVPDEYKVFIKINPLAPLMISWRELFLNGGLDLSNLLLCSLYSAVVFIFGYMVYKRLSWRFAEVL
ncbi:MAG: hypothetical protein Fur0020_09840 [Thermodesulfovibrionia bacterium]